MFSSKKIKGYKFNELFWSFLFIMPALTALILFRIYPIIYSLRMSFYEWDGLAANPVWIGIRNYQRLIFRREFWMVFGNTVYYTIGYVVLSLTIALVLAVLLNQKIRGLVVLRTSFFAPYVASAVSVSLIWMYIFEPHSGLLNWLLDFIGIAGPRWLLSTSWAMPAVILVTVWQHTGFYMVIFLAGLQSIPDEPYEAATLDGASELQSFRYITLPLLTPIIFFVSIISIINAFRVFDHIYILTQGGPVNATNVIVFHFYEYAFRFFNFGYASAVATALFLIVTLLTIFQFKMSRHWVHYEYKEDV